ncbi:hypothetical protein C8F01DRAFT_1255258 [Mycena amicta]|nr:hypothetical protein C8F01DRAFT_1255258 [Mycena amicta]
MGRKRRRGDVVFDDSVANPSADIGFHFSTTLPHTIATVSNVTAQKEARVEDEVDEEYAPFEPPSHLASEELAAIANTLTGEGDDTYHLFIEEDEDASKKRQRYESSVLSVAGIGLWPVLTPFSRIIRWLPGVACCHTMLDHLLRHDGLGEDTYKPQCSFCEMAYEVGGETRLFRCQECGIFLQCLSCLEERHKLNPLHVVKEWTGDYWDCVALHRTHLRDVSTKSLQVYLPARAPGTTMQTPSISLRYDDIAQLMANGWYPATVLEPSSCATFRVLELYRQLNVVGNVNAHDFVGTLERLVDPTLLSGTPDRYKVFSRMARQYAFLKRVKRSGVGPQATGWNAKEEEGEACKVAAGRLAVRCWACPRVDFNLPPGWDRCDPDDKFLYSLLLAMDANFRLKNRMRANERQDPSLGSGWGCFVDDGPYKDHLREYVAEEDVSTCIAFAALMQKDTRLTTGLRVSGVGGCVCARHGILQALGLGDLQRGERYVNMDYILMHALGDARVKLLVLSYDIACQWKQNLRTRVINITAKSTIPPNLDNFDIQFALPVWHAAAHEESCQMENSLSYARGVGRTDREGIEGMWAMLNPIAFSTKEMGAGNRHDTIEDRIDHISFEKNVGQGDTLTRKLIIAVAERDKQILEFIDVDSGLDPSLRREWRKQIDDWLGDKSKPNPYIIAGGKDAGPSEAQVAADLKKAELADARAGRGDFVEAGMTAAAFIKGLLQLEDLKRRIKNEVRGSSGLTADRASQIDELRVSFFKKLKAIRRQQDVFMPGVASLRAAEEDRRDSDRLPPAAEDTKLWLPSDLTETQRGRTCKRGLLDIEGQLRRAQCGDALSRIRSLLYAKTHLIHHRNANSVGQRATTRSSSLILRSNRPDRPGGGKIQAGAAGTAPSDGPSFCSGSQGAAGLRRERAGDRRRATLGRDCDWVDWEAACGTSRRWHRMQRRMTEERCRGFGLRFGPKTMNEECTTQYEYDGRRLWPGVIDGLKKWLFMGEIAERFVNAWTRSGKAAVQAVMREDAEVYRALLTGEDEVMPGSIDELEATA